nr:hypothetical protein [Lactiplantibacillus plantarum]
MSTIYVQPKEYVNSNLVNLNLVNKLKLHGRLYSANFYSRASELDKKIDTIVRDLNLKINYLHFDLYKHYSSYYRRENICCYTKTGSAIVQSLSGGIVDQCLLLHDFYALDWTDPTTIDQENGEKEIVLYSDPKTWPHDVKKLPMLLESTLDLINNLEICEKNNLY